MGITSIEWCDRTVNPIRARVKSKRKTAPWGHFCEKVSPGCKNCYASRLQFRFKQPAFDKTTRKRTEFRLDPAKLIEVLAQTDAQAWFWEDMSDLFGAWVPDRWIDACLAVMLLTPQHTHLILTKRASRLRKYSTTLAALTPDGRAKRLWKAIPKAVRDALKARRLPPDTLDYLKLWPVGHIGLGVSVEDQPRADERLPDLAFTPGTFKFVSLEPLLGPITLRFGACNCPDKPDAFKHGHFVGCSLFAQDPKTRIGGQPTELGWLTWAIMGGESGPGARWNNIHWTRSLLRQCAQTGTARFVKQLGSRPTASPIGTVAWDRMPVKPPIIRMALKDSKGSDLLEIPEEFRVREYPVQHVAYVRGTATAAPPRATAAPAPTAPAC